jgi:pyridoxamine 5'-phosphate oxidase
MSSRAPDDDPLQRFRRLRQEAAEADETEAGRAFVLATSVGGQPSARYLLLKGVEADAFVFFTNYRSRKARELTANPQAALSFSWPRIRVEVEVRGSVERLDSAGSDAYFATRGRVKQLGAWASRQSEPIDHRLRLAARVLVHGLRFLGRPVPRPTFWGGFRLRPEAIEFLTWDASQVAARESYHRLASGWTSERDFGFVVADLGRRDP